MFTVVVHTDAGPVVWRHNVASWDLPWECFRASREGTVTVYLTHDFESSPSPRLYDTLNWIIRAARPIKA